MLLATMLTLSHWLERMRVNVEAAGEAGPGPGALQTCEDLASQLMARPMSKSLYILLTARLAFPTVELHTSPLKNRIL
jgi:hypothetical protein